MKVLECYQPRGIAKLLFYLFLLWTVICCISVISNNDYFIEGIVCSIFFDITFCDMIDDIMSLQFSTIFEYLQAKVIKEAETKNLADFQSLIMK